MAGAIILSIGFGIKVEAENDPHVKTAERGLEAISAGSTAQAAMFDFFPMLKNMPSWFPGAGFKEEAKGLRRFSKAMVDGPMQATKDAMAAGKASSSVASAMMTQLETEPQTEVEELVAKQLPSNMYLGGADTTVCALAYFFLAMTLYPEVQRKAQDEIDLVVGHDRLPDWSDQQSLPYVDALVKEVLRWRNITPLGVYHRLTANDIYEDYFLPAGSTVVGNIWAILHDEIVFPDPLAFKPERFLDSKVDFPEMVFGFGRRICPGMYLARESVWMAVASVLASFDISKARDENGKEIEPVDDCVEGIVA
ncbi:cytochrome P450 [Stereum hirsutum FP-91666 SS1]|uniref:cytochrome P450 n=1 Tax=Stereum hirsutum (strain FP-91666) TaxID=721885 RepID=UPI0004449B7A|nr:cytochrome P450 [Stereum hirsutum FP-91666 SS1]EIM84337.1 cytochrome P450 [Stereum hirsutum FP-91666 SS1]